jgi:hydrophobe/amphiphile efflux-1 (HAE1) family protein
MSFHLSAWSIKKPVPTIVMFLILGMVGFLSFTRLGIDESPNIDIPAVIVNVSQPGASPVEIETEITKKIEDSVAGLDNIDEIRSNVTEGSSTTTVNFILGTDTDRATNDVRNAISQIKSQLPQDINDPTVTRLNFAGGSIITYALISESKTVEELSDLVDRTISKELRTIAGVATIDRFGGVDREIRVDLDSQRLQAYNITATQVNEQIKQFNLNLPAGRSQIGGSEQNVRTLGSAKTVEDLRNYEIVLPNQDTVKLKNLGEVIDGFKETRQIAYLNGKSVVAFSIKRSPGSTLVSVEAGVREKIAQLEKTMGQDLEFQMIFTRANSIRESYQATIDSLIEGCILTIITVGFFIKDWRIVLITGSALPLSIIPTFFVMELCGFTLNSMSLLALAIAIGNLIDDAVCMIENIDQHLEMGKSPYQAALDGSKEIGLAVVATAATIIVVFVPVAFMGGVPGQYFRPFGVTVAVSTLFSTLVATTITPMLSAYLLKPKTKFNDLRVSQYDDKDQVISSAPKKFQPYRSLLTWALRHRITTLIMAVAFFIGSLQLIPHIPKGLFDSGDTGLSTLSLELPPGSTLTESEEVFFQANNILSKNPAVDKILGIVGNEGQVNGGIAYIKLKPKEERDISQKEFEKLMRQPLSKIPGARISFSSRGARGGRKELSIVLQSENGELLTKTAETLETQMREIPGLVEVASSTSLVKPELIITPDPQRASDLGVSVQSIARTASLALIGDSESNLAKFNLSDRQIPIKISINPAERTNIDTIKNLRVPSSKGDLVPLNAVATFTLGSGPANIERFNRNRQVSVEANLQELSLGQALAQVQKLPILKSLPPEIAQKPSGNAKIMKDIFTRFAGALALGVFCIYAILVLLYNNFIYPMAILSALPLSIGGALLGLLIAQKELGLYALIGIVLLMGLVTKNAILLVDFALVGLREGKTQFQAIIQAGVSRLRPILMTSLATVAGMIPLALEWGAAGEVRSPMAIAVVGGFTTSTLLTLVVVPVLFSFIDNFLRRLKRFFNSKEAEMPTIREKETIKN